MNRFLIVTITCAFALTAAPGVLRAQQADTAFLPCACDTTHNYTDTSSGITPGAMILETGRMMVGVMRTIVRGSCWDFVNEVYCRSGLVNLKKTVFKSAKRGPYASAEMVRPGDWIYHLNHQYTGGEHSAIFVCWKDFKKRIAITLSYAGMNRNVPGRYGEYDLRSIYAIFRPYFPSLDPGADGRGFAGN